jgi:hypothetical protein
MRRPNGTLLPGHHGFPNSGKRRLQGDFLRDLATAWAEHGKAALAIMVKEEPSHFVKCVASLMPKEFLIDSAGPLSDMDDAQLDDLIAMLRQRVNEQRAVEAKQVVPMIERKTEKVDASSD